MALKALFYPDVPFDTLFIPYIYKEIYLDGVYIDILNQRKDMVIIDVGANCGIVTHHMIPHAKKIYAIEPSPEHFEALKKNKEFNRWDNVEVFNIALADKDGEMEFSININNRTMNTLIVGKDMEGTRDHIVKSEASKIPLVMSAKGYMETIAIQTKAIDTFFKDNTINRVDFVKMDIEGAEEMILRSQGFRNVADTIGAIMVEFNFPTWPHVVEYMQGLGFTSRRYQTSSIIFLFTKK